MIYDLLGLFSIRKLCIQFARHLHYARNYNLSYYYLHINK